MNILCPTVRAAKGIASASFSSFVLRFRLTFCSPTGSPLPFDWASVARLGFTAFAFLRLLGFVSPSASSAASSSSLTSTAFRFRAARGFAVIAGVVSSCCSSPGTSVSSSTAVVLVRRLRAGSSTTLPDTDATSDGAEDKADDSSLAARIKLLLGMLSGRAYVPLSSGGNVRYAQTCGRRSSRAQCPVTSGYRAVRRECDS